MRVVEKVTLQNFFFPFFTFILTFQMLEEVRDLSAISENFFRNHKVTYLSQHNTSSKIKLHHLMIARKKHTETDHETLLARPLSQQNQHQTSSRHR